MATPRPTGRPEIPGLDVAARLGDAAALELLRAAVRAGPLELRVRGVSMRPFLRPGDRVRLAARAPRRGDVALVVWRGRLLLHRLVRRRGEAWLVRGDARLASDGWIGPGRIVGVAVARARRRSAGWIRLDGGLRRWLAIATLPAWRGARRALGVRLRRGRASRVGARAPGSRAARPG